MSAQDALDDAARGDHDADAHIDASEGRLPPNPWERSSILIGGIWLVFLAFPIMAAWTSDAELWARIVTIGVIAAFAAVYLHGYTVGHWERVTRAPILHLIVLCALAAASYPVAGLNGPLTCLIFVMSYATFVFPIRVSLAVSAGAYAVLVLLTVSSGGLSEWWFLTGLAFVVGVGVAAARLTAQSGERHQQVERQLVITQERERVARDVHDLLGHSLTAITIKAELAEKLLDVDLERARTEIVEIQELSREAITEVRQTVGSLRARRLDAEIDGAAAALRAAGIEVVLPDDVTVVEPRLRMLFAWVIREAATNVLRHASASRCWIELGRTHAMIADDGTGAVPVHEGNGLRGLRERVEEAGGRLVVTDRADGGTVVEVTA